MLTRRSPIGIRPRGELLAAAGTCRPRRRPSRRTARGSPRRASRARRSARRAPGCAARRRASVSASRCSRVPHSRWAKSRIVSTNARCSSVRVWIVIVAPSCRSMPGRSYWQSANKWLQGPRRVPGRAGPGRPRRVPGREAFGTMVRTFGTMVPTCYSAYHMTAHTVPHRGRGRGAARRPRVGDLARPRATPRLYLVMLYPLLLQVAHPDRRRRRARLLRLRAAALEPPAADARLRQPARLRRPRRRRRPGGGCARCTRASPGVREDGKRYYALEPEAYAWVHATLLETYVAGHAQFGRPMTPAQIDALLPRVPRARPADRRPRARPARNLGRLPRLLRPMVRDPARPHRVGRPGDPRRSGRGRRRCRCPTRSGARSGCRPADSLWIGGIGLMDPALRERLGIAWSRPDELSFRGARARSPARSTPLMPRRLRIMGPDQLRLRRRAIARGPLGRDSGSSGSAPPPRSGSAPRSLAA